MDIAMFVELLAGPLGGFFVVIAVLLSVVKFRYLAPGWSLVQAEERIELLDAENRKLSESITRMNDQNAELRVSLARFEEQITHMTKEVESLRAEVSRLRSAS